jgi:hypothetical protein
MSRSIHQRSLYLGGASLMLLDAVLYSVGAGRPIRAAITPPDPYWNKRLLLNLLLANAGLYFTAALGLIGAFAADQAPRRVRPTMVLSLLACLYSPVSVLVLTPRDWPHGLPRALGGVLIAAGLGR